MSVESTFNDRALEIWREHLAKSTLMPALYPPGHFKQNLKLLMLGMNPAFSENSIRKRLRELNIDKNANDVFGWAPNTEPQHIHELLDVESHAFVHYQPFFGPLRRFTEKVGCANSYSHLDLFHWRQTEQNDFLQVVGLPGALNKFGRAQIALTRETIGALRPNVVVIANATAAKMAVEHLPLSYVANSHTQCTLPGLDGTRFFLAGMLSGGRAMDTFSRIRLEVEVWSYLDSTGLLESDQP
jgi:hypothetical protein